MNKFYIMLLIIISFCFAAGGCAANPEAAAAKTAAKAEELSQSVQKAEENTKPAVNDDAVSQNENAEQTDSVERTETEDSGNHETDGKATPSQNGKLSVSGTALIDESGNEVVLRGISTHGLSWFLEYVNEECFKQLSGDFGANAVRLAMYTAESGGYNTDGDKERLKQLVKDGVNYTKEADMYAIIDWHTLSDNDPNIYLDEAKEFFDEISEEFADYDNVIYEICNEPNGGTTWGQIKEYAEEVIPVIRQNDKDAVILTGTPNWCQYIDEAAADPLDFENVMYTVHYYAATHKEDLREKVIKAHEDGLPVFISEYGIGDASGNGAVDYEQAQLWTELADELNLSSVMWNLSNKNETSAIISSVCDKTSGFTESDLSAAGKWIKAYLNGESITDYKEESNAPRKSEVFGQNAPKTVKGASDSLKISVEAVNLWEENGKPVTQYLIKIENTGEQTDGWSITLKFDGDFAYKDGWNGNYSAAGNELTITNTDYNGIIKRGDILADIGFIIAGEGKIINAS